MKSSIFGRMTSILIGASVIPTLLMGVMMLSMTYQGNKKAISAEINARGEILVSVLAESSRYAVASGNMEQLRDTCENLLHNDRHLLRIQIEDIEHHSLSFTSQALTTGSPYVFQKDIVSKVINFEQFGNTGQRQDPSTDSTDHKIGVIRVEFTPDVLDDAMRERTIGIAAIIIASFLASVFLGMRLTKNTNDSIRGLMKMLKEFQSGNFKTRSTFINDWSEMGRMHETIQEMADTIDAHTQNQENRIRERTAALEKANAEKRDLIAHSTHQLEDERKRIAGELHDYFNGVLIAVRMRAQFILDSATDESPQATEIRKAAADIVRHADQAYASARRLVRDLRPEVIDTLGFLPSIEELVRRNNDFNQDCVFDLQVEDHFTVDEVYAITGYRVVQECLANAVKHSHASLVTVSIRADLEQGLFYIVVSDNGRGIATESASRTGFGLVAMRERVESVGGRIAIESGPETGTTLRFILPLKA